MDDFLKNARKQLEELDIQGHLEDLDLSGLKDVDLKKSGKQLKKQLRDLDIEKREQDAANEGFLGGVLLGIVVGAVLALIFAPKSGSETREMVADTATDLKHKAEELVGQAKDEQDSESASNLLSDEPAIEREIGDTTTRPTPGVI